jgi:hypothetical protein
MDYSSDNESGYTTSDNNSQLSQESLYKLQDLDEVVPKQITELTLLTPRTTNKLYMDELSNYSSDNDEPLIPRNDLPKIFDTKKYGFSPSIFFNPYSQKTQSNPQIIHCLEGVFKKTSKYIQVKSSKEDYGNLYEEIGKFVTADIACKGLNQEYIEKSLAYCDAIIVIGPAGIPLLPNNETPQLKIGDKIPIYAFSTLILKPQEYVKTDIICSNNTLFSGAGSNLMDAIEEMAKLIWAKYIVLESVPTAISFYEKFGFKKIKLIAEGLMEMKKETGLCPMVNMFTPTRGGKKRKTKKQKTKKQKTKKQKTKKQKTKKIKFLTRKTKRI